MRRNKRPGPAAACTDYLNDLAEKAPAGFRGLLYLPYLATAATPRWNATARSAFVGMSFVHGRPAKSPRAVMEGVALEHPRIMQVFPPACPWNCCGWAAAPPDRRSGTDIQADVYGRPVQTLRAGESTGLGAALLGGVGAGVFASIEEGVEAMVNVTGQVEPDPANHKVYDDMYQAYVMAYEGLSNCGAFARLAEIQARLSQLPGRATGHKKARG